MVIVEDRILYESDVDRIIRISTGLDLTGYAAADLTFTVTRPDGTTYTMTNTRAIDSVVTGQVSAKTSSTQLNQTGMYLIQVVAAKLGSPNQASAIFHFYVNDRM